MFPAEMKPVRAADIIPIVFHSENCTRRYASELSRVFRCSICAQSSARLLLYTRYHQNTLVYGILLDRKINNYTVMLVFQISRFHPLFL